MNQGQKPPANLQTLSRQQWPEQTCGWWLMFLPCGYTEIPFHHWFFLVFRQNFYHTLVSAPPSTCMIEDAGRERQASNSGALCLQCPPRLRITLQLKSWRLAGWFLPHSPQGLRSSNKVGWTQADFSPWHRKVINSGWWLVWKGLQKGNWSP